jgi:hypothetical protein
MFGGDGSFWGGRRSKKMLRLETEGKGGENKN